MATRLDVNLRAVALDIITEFGKDLTFYNTVEGTYDPDTRETTPASETTYTVRTSPPEYEKRYELGQTVRTGRLQVLIPAKDLNATFAADVLDTGCRVDFDSTSWQITEIERVYSGDQVCVYRCVLAPRVMGNA